MRIRRAMVVTTAVLAFALAPGMAGAQAPTGGTGTSPGVLALPPPGQPGTPAPPPGPAPTASPPVIPQELREQGADQVDGLFFATCLHFGGDVRGLRAWLNGQGAPQMPSQVAALFLQGRPGQVFDTSYQTVRLALVSLDSGGCEAVGDFADGSAVQAILREGMLQLHLPLTTMGPVQTVPGRPGLERQTYTTRIGNTPGTITVTTASQGAPQALLDFEPQR